MLRWKQMRSRRHAVVVLPTAQGQTPTVVCMHERPLSGSAGTALPYGAAPRLGSVPRQDGAHD